MKVNSNSYYRFASGFVKSKKKKTELLATPLYFTKGHMEAWSKKLTSRILYPVVSKGYTLLEKTVPRSIGWISPDWGQKLQEGWRDPVSSEKLLSASKKIQSHVEPLAAKDPSAYPRMNRMAKMVIGLARFIDVSLKDATTILELPARASKLYNSRPLKAFIADKTTILGKIKGGVVCAVYSLIYLILKLVSWIIWGSQTISQTVHMGRHITDSVKGMYDHVESGINYLFESKIREKEIKIRKELVSKGAKGITKLFLYLFSSTCIRALVQKSVLIGGVFALRALFPMPEESTFHQSVEWLMDKATFYSLFGVSLLLKIQTATVFFDEFTKDFGSKYNVKDHSLIYNKSFFSVYFNFKKLIKFVKNELKNN